MTTKKLLLFSHCCITKGISRSAIIDLQRAKVHLIPNSLAELIIDGRYLNLDYESYTFDESEQEIFNEYYNLLIDLELAFIVEDDFELSCFPAMSTEYLFPAHISNCILDTISSFEYFDSAFLSQLESLCCNYIQFRFFNAPSFKYLYSLIDLVENSQIKAVEILMPQSGEPDFYANLSGFVEKGKKISNVIVFRANEDGTFREGFQGMGYILKVKQEHIHNTHCGVIDESLFTINIPTYTESLAHNTCLNRKVSIDTNGNIKNCPSMVESFGNIKDTTLQNAIEKPGFKRYWHIKKDEISKCKDCEFRHVCTDCRAYLENPEDVYSPPLKCGYDPVTNEWEEWSTNSLKQQSMQFYSLQNQ